MKQLSILPHSVVFLRTTLLPAMIVLWCTGVLAQAKPVTKSTAKLVTQAPAASMAASTTPAKTVIPIGTTVLDVPPLVKNMEEYQKTPAYAKRKAAYDKSTPAPMVTKYPFKDDNSSLTITLDKKLPAVNWSDRLHQIPAARRRKRPLAPMIAP